MKTTDHAEALNAIIGKTKTGLKESRGLAFPAAMVMKIKTMGKLAKRFLASTLLGGVAERGWATDVWVPNLELQFSKIAHHGDPFGFNLAVASFSFDGSPGWPRYRHPGGIQVANDVLAVAFEQEEDAEVQHAVGFFRLTDPLHPVLLNRSWVHPGLLLPISEDPALGVVGMIQDPNTGRYLLVFTVTADSSYLGFYETSSSNLADPSLIVQPLDLWHKSELGNDEGDWREWQCLNFLRQSDGSLYLACSGANASGFGTEDWIRLYRVIRNGNVFTLQSATGRHLQSGEPQLGDCGAAGGFYVSPTGQLIFYLSEHENDGPDGSVLMGEFRNYDVREPVSVGACGGWVEFYEDESGWADSSPDRSVIWDFVDAQKEDWQDLAVMGWNDEIDSIRWNLPPGMEVTLYKDAGFSGDSMVLSGQGVYGSLDAFGFGDCISSVQATAGHLLEVLVSKNCVPAPGGPCANTVAGGLQLLDRCSSRSHFLNLAPDVYSEVLVIDQEVTLRVASQGTVTIGR